MMLIFLAKPPAKGKYAKVGLQNLKPGSEELSQIKDVGKLKTFESFRNQIEQSIDLVESQNNT